MSKSTTVSGSVGHNANTFIQGNCIDVMQQMPAESIDLIVTDPPYLVNYQDRSKRTVSNDGTKDTHWLDPAYAEMYRVLKPNSFCISFYGYYRTDLFLAAWKKAGFYPVGHFVATKSYASSKGYTRRLHECAYLLVKGKPSKPEHTPSDILPWVYSGNKLHPTQKPLETMMPLIRAYSEPGQIVLDPFAGSGTTCAAAQLLKRRFIGIESDPTYYVLARKRLEARG